MDFTKDFKLLEMKRRTEFALKHDLELKSKNDGLKIYKDNLANFKKILIEFAEDNGEMGENLTIETIENTREDILKLFSCLVEIQTNLGRLKNKIILGD